MKKLIVVYILSLFTIMQLAAQTIITGTFNLRYDNPKDSGNLWKDRAPVAASLIRFHGFDIVGTQEGLKNQLEDLQQSLPEYAYYGIGRDDGKAKGEHSAIFYKKEKYNVIDSGDFWLSENPGKPGFGWDARHNRICSWIKFKEKKGKKTFYVFNVHYDHQGVQARKESSKLIMQKIQELAAGKPVILTGDFNGNHQSEWYNFINQGGVLKDALLQAAHPYRNNGSFNSFKTNNPSNEIITDTYHGRFPSDHYPVLTELQW
jgi:endonuclease/exonuclease/phosphatase family metal-dependent hydrolase